MPVWLQRYRGYLILSLLFAVILGAVLLWRQPAPAAITLIEPTPLPTATPVHIVIYVSGAVAHPEVYTLPENSRVKDALIVAGGLRPEADAAGLNLAALLHDGQELHIPAVGEVIAPSAGDASADPDGGAARSPLNVNTAAAGELEQLPGIGAVLAQRIIQDRQANGPYRSVQDLQRVKGVGQALLQKLEGLVVCR